MERTGIRPWSLASCSLLVALWACTEGGPSDDDVVAELGESVDGSSSESVDESSGESESSSESESIDGSSSESESVDSSESGVECSYPDGAVEPMALGEVLTAYAWPTAIHADGTTTSLDLLHVPCATDEVIDWSIHELLVFISLPAW